MSKPKIAISLILLGCVVWLTVSIPIPWYHEAPCVLEPQGVVLVPAPTTGRIVLPDEYQAWYSGMAELQDRARKGIQPNVNPADPTKLIFDPTALDIVSGMPTPQEYAALPKIGSTIQEGAVIAVLEHADDLKRHDDLRRRVKEFTYRTRELAQYTQNDDINSANDPLAEALELQKTIGELAKLNSQRVIRAPITGTLIAAKRVPEQPRSDVEQMKLETWNGTPLDPGNAGCSVEAGQEVVSIAPSEKLQAVLYIDQTDRDDLPKTMEVEIKLDHLADITWETIVSQVSLKGEVMAPEALTTRFGGALATKPSQQGQEQLASTSYRAIAELHFDHPISQPDAVLMRPGMRGTARFMVSNRTLLDWGKRYFFETFRFRL